MCTKFCKSIVFNLVPSQKVLPYGYLTFQLYNCYMYIVLYNYIYHQYFLKSIDHASKIKKSGEGSTIIIYTYLETFKIHY